MDFKKQKQEKIEFFLDQAEQYDFSREHAKAMIYYIRAGLLGDERAIRIVCNNVKTGYGLSYNYDEFFRCMKIGAENYRIADAMYELGVCYSSGIGTEKNEAEAMHWFSEGAMAGSKAAKRSLRTYNYDLTITQYDELSPFAMLVRTSVFVNEQGYKNEFDFIDENAHHFVIFDGKKPVATARVYFDALMETYCLGRIAVLKDYRGLGLGEDLIEAAQNYVKDLHGRNLALHAQVSKMSFYERFGYQAEGEQDEDEGIPHVWMWKRFAE